MSSASFLKDNVWEFSKQEVEQTFLCTAKILKISKKKTQQKKRCVWNPAIPVVVFECS